MKIDTILIISLALSLIAVALNLWQMWRRNSTESFGEEEWAEVATLDAFWELFRAELLAGGRGKHYAYRVADDGTLLAIDATYVYFAIMTGVDGLWEVIDSVRRARGNAFAVSLDEIDLGDGKRNFTYIDDGGRNNCFVDSDTAATFLLSNHCTRASADDFKSAVIDAQTKANERNRGRYSRFFHRP